MEPIATEVRDAIAARDSATARSLPQPHLQQPHQHRIGTDGPVIRGRSTVLAALEQTGPPVRPARVELRSGQIDCWTDG